MSKNIHPIEQEELMAYLDGELEAGRATIADSKAAEYFRIEAEILLFKAEAR